MNHFRYRE
jgi:hypothetical protein